MNKEQKHFRFWHEMKRRGVPRVLAMYAATAFIILEASDIIFPRLGLPDWTVTLLIILLILGFLLAFILSWIFDITPQGVIKTAPLAETGPSEETDVRSRRKLRRSDIIIVVLIGIVLVLLYPKIFGARVDRTNHGPISIAVMPFKNMTGDTVFNIWQGGLQNLMITALSNSEALKVCQYETMLNVLKKEAETNYASISPSLAGTAARKLEANTVVIGNLYKSGGFIRITCNIMNPESEVINKSFELQGDSEEDFFSLADKLSKQIKDYLEIKSLKKQTFYEMQSVYTQSSEAYKLYLLGQNYYARLNYSKAIENFSRAIELDSSFVSAMLKLGYCYGDTRQSSLSQEWAYRAYEQIHRLPEDMQWLVHILVSTVEKRPLDQIYYLDLYLDMHPMAMIKHYQLGWVRFNLEQWEEAIESFERSLELSDKQGGTAWVWTYSMLGNAYHNTGMHKKEQDIFETGKELWPQQRSRFDYWQAVCAISRGDSAEASLYLDEIRKMTEQAGWPEANLWLWHAGVYQWAEDFEQAEFYYRKAMDMRPDNPQLMWEFAQFLIDRDRNVQEGLELIKPLVEQYPEDPDYLYTYGLGLFKKGIYQEARQTLQQSWDLRAYYDHNTFTMLKEVDDMLDKAQG